MGLMPLGGGGQQQFGQFQGQAWQNPDAYMQTFDPFNGADMVTQGMMAEQGIPGALSAGALAANTLSSGNVRAQYGPEASMYLGNIDLQKQRMQNQFGLQKLQYMGPLLMALMGQLRGGLGGQSGLAGFQGNTPSGGAFQGAGGHV